jgi:hypothetical protein
VKAFLVILNDYSVCESFFISQMNIGVKPGLIPPGRVINTPADVAFGGARYASGKGKPSNQRSLKLLGT